MGPLEHFGFLWVVFVWMVVGVPWAAFGGPRGVLGASLGDRVAFWLAPGAGSGKVWEIRGGMIFMIVRYLFGPIF